MTQNHTDVNNNYDAVERTAEIEREEALLSEMGLTRQDTEKLRDTMLSADEAVAAKQEEITTIRQHKGRKSDWEEYADAKRRMGKVLHHSEFIRRLRTIIPTLTVTDGRVRGTLTLLMIRSTPVKEIPDYAGTFKFYAPCPIYIGWIHAGWMPEYEIDLIDDDQCAIGQKRGWRTILLRMIVRWNKKLKVNGDPELDIHGVAIRESRASIITEEQADQAFGSPTQGWLTATAYRHQLHDFRNAVPEKRVTDRD
jgi:hypothetical protein